MSKITLGAPQATWNGRTYFANDEVKRVQPGKGNILIPWKGKAVTGSNPNENIPNSSNNLPDIIKAFQNSVTAQQNTNNNLNPPPSPIDPDTQFMLDFNQVFGAAFGNSANNTLVQVKKDNTGQLVTTEEIKVNNQTIPKGSPLPLNYDLDNAQSTAFGITKLLPANLNYKTLASSTDIVAFTNNNTNINGVNVPSDTRIDIEIAPNGDTITSEDMTINGIRIPKGSIVPISKINGKLDPSSIGTIYSAPATNRRINPQDYGEDNPIALLYTKTNFTNILTTWQLNTTSDFLITPDGVPVPPYGAIFFDPSYATKFDFDPKGDPLQSVTDANGVQTVYRRYNDKFTISVEKNA